MDPSLSSLEAISSSYPRLCIFQYAGHSSSRGLTVQALDRDFRRLDHRHVHPGSESTASKQAGADVAKLAGLDIEEDI